MTSLLPFQGDRRRSGRVFMQNKRRAAVEQVALYAGRVPAQADLYSVPLVFTATTLRLCTQPASLIHFEAVDSAKCSKQPPYRQKLYFQSHLVQQISFTESPSTAFWCKLMQQRHKNELHGSVSFLRWAAKSAILCSNARQTVL